MKSYHAIIITSIWIAIALLMELTERHSLMFAALGVVVGFMTGAIVFFIREWNEEAQ